MKKYIHYCWFGGKPLSKLAKKCIKSWKKYLPDYEIIEWNENNFDVNVTKFSRQAYQEKKWAFVSDVARIYALKKYGGIYFDTDMLIKKKIDDILDADIFAGWESEYNVAVGVLGVRNKDHKLLQQLWDFYCENEFSSENAFSLSIPAILTNILKNNYGLVSNHLENQVLKDNIKIYARDYFYPISSDSSEKNMFTDNTYMVHYYIGSWISEKDKKRMIFEMIFGKKIGNFVLDILVKIKHILKSILKIILYPFIKYRRKILKDKELSLAKENFLEELNQITNTEYIVFCNKNWIGTKNATLELFDNVVCIDEICDERLAYFIAEKIVEKNIKLVAFSAFSNGWDIIIKNIKNVNNNIIIKVIWHGSLALNTEDYDWKIFEKIFRLLNQNIINSIAFVKESLYEFFKEKGYNVELLYNTVYIDTKKYISESKKDDDLIKIGLYASGDRWVKNFYNQLGAASLIKNSKIDCIPINDKTLKIAKIFKTTIIHYNTTFRSCNRSKFFCGFSAC